jgi:hypothetical protein
MYELVRQIWEEERMPEEWKEYIYIYEKGERDSCENIRKCSLQNFG